MRVSLLHAQIIEGHQGGSSAGPYIGDVLNKNAEYKLPLEGEDTETDPARVRLNKLVRECGLLNRKSRPNITTILVEAKSIFDSPGVVQVGNRKATYTFHATTLRSVGKATRSNSHRRHLWRKMVYSSAQSVQYRSPTISGPPTLNATRSNCSYV